MSRSRTAAISCTRHTRIANWARSRGLTNTSIPRQTSEIAAVLSAKCHQPRAARWHVTSVTTALKGGRPRSESRDNAKRDHLGRKVTGSEYSRPRLSTKVTRTRTDLR